MMFYAILILFVAVIIFSLKVSSADIPPKPAGKTPIPPTYKQDIDWSLMVKGYPVVNDVDIAYTEREVMQAKIEAAQASLSSQY